MKYIIKNCENCYNYGENPQDYWCEFEHNNTLFTNPCKESDCLLKQIVNKCQSVKDKGFCMSRYGVKVPVSEGWDLASEILELLEIEEVDD